MQAPNAVVFEGVEQVGANQKYATNSLDLLK